MRKVFIGKFEKNGDDEAKIKAKIADIVSKALDWIEWEKIVKNGDKVFIKPNLTLPSYHRGVTTNPLVLEALVKKLKDKTDKIYIGESNGGLGCFSADKAFLGHGLDKLAKKYDARLVNLSTLSFRKVDFQLNKKQVKIEIPNFLLDDVDVFINIPVLKTHAMVKVTIGFKNLW